MAVTTAILQPTVVTAKFSSGPAASVTTDPVTTVSGRLLVAVPIANLNNIGATPITDSLSQTWATAIASFGNTQGWGAMFYVENCVGGASHTFTFTPTSNDYIGLIVVEFPGMALSGSLNQTDAQSSNASATHTAGPITANATLPEVFVGVQVSTSFATVQVSNAYWGVAHRRNADVSTEGATVVYRVVHPGTSDSVSLTYTAEFGTTLIAGFKAAALSAGGGGMSWTPVSVVAAAGTSLVRAIASGMTSGRG